MAQLLVSLSSLQEPQQHKSENPKFLSPSQSKTNQKFQPLHSNIKLKRHKLQYPIFFPLLFSWKPKKERKLNNGFSPPSFDVAKLVFSPPSRHSKPRRTRWSHQKSLSRKVSEFWMFWFALYCVLGLRSVFVTVGLEVGYEDWRKHTIGRFSDTFQTIGRQSDFRLNHRWVMCKCNIMEHNKLLCMGYSIMPI